ncbi:MAG TPA: HdeD family acid-resistance protein [Povalibacter sp.]|nr:HdeD family acid-resistance protein [Povalibacter sp.]
MPLSALIEAASRNWWLIALRGVIAVLFGILAWIWPGITLLALVVLWGVYSFADGVLSLVTAFRWRDSGKPLWALIVVGLAGIAAGIVAFVWPQITALVLLMFIAAWAIVIGIFQIVTAIRIRKEIEGEWLLGLSGAVSLIFGLLMVANPGAGAIAVVWLIGVYAVFFGVLLIGLSWRLKSLVPRAV